MTQFESVFIAGEPDEVEEAWRDFAGPEWSPVDAEMMSPELQSHFVALIPAHGGCVLVVANPAGWLTSMIPRPGGGKALCRRDIDEFQRMLANRRGAAPGS